MPDIVTSHENQIKANADHARTMLSGFTDRAVQILQELAELGDTDRIRLSAVNSILDRAGVITPTEIKVSASKEEHDLVKHEVYEVMERIQANVTHKAAPKSLEAIMIHEGDEEPEVLAVVST